jgi:hypothetical protein
MISARPHPALRRRRIRLVTALAILATVGLSALPTPAQAGVEYVHQFGPIADTWIPATTPRYITKVAGNTVQDWPDICINAVNWDDSSWAGTTYCGHVVSHPYCGCRLRIGGGHAFPGTWTWAAILQYW